MILLDLVYVAYLCFQLYSHTALFDDSGDDANDSTRYLAHLPTQSPVDSVSEVGSSTISEETPKMSSWMATMSLVIFTIVSPLLRIVRFAHQLFVLV